MYPNFMNMKWNELRNSYFHDYPFASNFLYVTPPNTAKTIHPVMLFSTMLVLRLADDEKYKRLCIFFPDKKNAAKDIALSAAFHYMKKDYENGSNKPMPYIKGQKLYFNGCLVEYNREFEEPKFGHSIELSCRDGYISFPWSEMLYFHPSDSVKKLSKLTDVSSSIRTVRQSEAPVDPLLDIITHGNRSFFGSTILLISGVTDAIPYYHDLILKGHRLGDYMIFKRGDDGVEPLPIGGESASGIPNIVLCPDLISASEYIANHGESIKMFVVDGMDRCMQNMQSFDEILDTGVRTVLVADNEDSENLHQAAERNFIAFRWDADIMHGVTDDYASDGSDFDEMVRDYLKQRVILEKCTCSRIELLIDQMLGIANYPADNPSLNEIWLGLVGIINRISRLCWNPGDKWLSPISARVEELRAKIQNARHWISDDTYASVNSILGAINEFIKEPFSEKDGKPDVLKNVLIENIGKKTFLMVDRDEDVADATEYWKKTLNNPISIGSYDQYKSNNNTESQEVVIIPGWLGSSRMSYLLNEVVGSTKHLMFYPQEENWNKSFKHNLAIKESFLDHRSDIASLLKIEPDNLPFSEEISVALPPQGSAFSIIEGIEQRVYRQKYNSQAVDSVDAAGTVKCILVIFEHGRFSFMTETHGVYVLNDLISGKRVSELTYTHANELRVNDWVLFRDSDRDLIREIADSILTETGETVWRDTANIWKKVLVDEFNNYQYKNYHYMNRILKEHGLKRHPVTIKQWMWEGTIGPHDDHDLDIIAETAHDKELSDRLQEVKEAIGKIRSVHLRASGFLMDQIRLALTGGSSYLLSGSPNGITVSLGKYGKAEIHKVSEIGKDPVQASPTKINRLLITEE